MTTEYKIDLIGNSLYFTGNINQFSAHEFVIKLQKLENSLKGKEDKQVNLYMSSDGGDVTSGFRMYEAIKFFEGKVNCYLEGFVTSSAIIAICAANKVISTPLTTFLIYQLSGYLKNSYQTTPTITEWYTILQNNIIDIYDKKTQGKVTGDMFKEETYLTAIQALNLGLIDEINNYPCLKIPIVCTKETKQDIIDLKTLLNGN